MWRVELGDLARLWRTDKPFPHVAIDGVLGDVELAGVMEVLDEEPVERFTSDLYAFDATAPEPTTQAFCELRDGFARDLAPVMSAISGKAVTRVDMRAYAYRDGDYLLPHTDHRDGLGRVLAYAYYLPTPAPPTGGELELYRCWLGDDGELASTESARSIDPRPNRLVVFEVSATSLHQVREVFGGMRLSLAGWFYA
jgi:Rps23 Pro-64 3,4-dihydroxylase Tpa1-like proline 4-hydroxylase